MAERFDVAIIGGGVVGCAIARELSRFAMTVVLLERQADVARGTSSKNSAVVHTGFNVPPGSLKARLNVAGAAVFENVCRELGVPFKRVGKLVIALQEEQVAELRALEARGIKNGVPSLEIIGRDEIKRLEPNISGVAALHAPTAAITCPYTLTIALAESAAENGAEVRLESPVLEISRGDEGFTLATPRGAVCAGLVINSAGLEADHVAEMAGVRRWRIYPCRGEYAILDRSKSWLISRMVYPVPPKGGPGLGVHLTPTVDGNILIGPSAEYVRSREDTRTTGEVRRQLLQEAAGLLPGISATDVIGAYSGVRPKLTPESAKGSADFVIEEAPEAPGMLHLVGIESPGLTAAPAIAKEVAGWVNSRLGRPEKMPASRERRHAVRFREKTLSEQAALIGADPDYGRIVCRCELVTKREILDAARNRLGAVSLTALKYRSRAMMGRCQGGFCGPRVVDLLIEEGVPPEEITLRGGDSWLFSGTSKGLRADGRAGKAGQEAAR
jgi:glycerol-3-phosphate dehydrogenase